MPWRKTTSCYGDSGGPLFIKGKTARDDVQVCRGGLDWPRAGRVAALRAPKPLLVHAFAGWHRVIRQRVWHHDPKCVACCTVLCCGQGVLRQCFAASMPLTKLLLPACPGRLPSAGVFVNVAHYRNWINTGVKVSCMYVAGRQVALLAAATGQCNSGHLPSWDAARRRWCGTQPWPALLLQLNRPCLAAWLADPAGPGAQEPQALPPAAQEVVMRRSSCQRRGRQAVALFHSTIRTLSVLNQKILINT